MTKERLFGIILCVNCKALRKNGDMSFIMSIIRDDVKKCCFTGYRPSKFTFGLDEKSKQYREFENLLIEGILAMTDEDCRCFYSGMAMGFDIIAAETVLLLKKSKKLSLTAVIPFPEQSLRFSEHWKKRYNAVLAVCDEKIILSEQYYSGCYQRRNEYMVDKSDYIITWYDGRSGGTKNTLDYAEKNNKFILNLNRKADEDFGIQRSFEIL